MQEQLFLLGITTLAILIATISDIKTFEIPDSISYFLIIFGISAQVLLATTSKSFDPISALGTSLILALLIATLLFVSGQWGGGDAKLLIGVAAMLPTYYTTTIPFILTFTVNLFLLGGIYSILIMTYLTVKNWNRLIKIAPIIKNLLMISLIALIISVIIRHPLLFILPIFAIAISLIYLAIIIQKHLFIKKIKPSQLTEGDWLTKDLKIGNKLIYKVRKTGVFEEDIKKIQKEYKKLIEVKTGIAFGPSFLFSIIVSGYFGDIIFKIIPFILSKI
jgi:Flp pilus assembly protein protease CpaA